MGFETYNSGSLEQAWQHYKTVPMGFETCISKTPEIVLFFHYKTVPMGFETCISKTPEIVLFFHYKTVPMGFETCNKRKCNKCKRYYKTVPMGFETIKIFI